MLTFYVKDVNINVKMLPMLRVVFHENFLYYLGNPNITIMLTYEVVHVNINVTSANLRYQCYRC